MKAAWLRVARRRRSVFLGVMLMLATTLGWLGWRLVTQDEQLAVQRRAEQREVAADLLVSTLGQRLSELEQDLDRVLAGGSPGVSLPTADGAVLVRMEAATIQAWPEHRLLYYPELPPPLPVSSPVFDEADDLEFRQEDSAAAIRMLAPLTSAPDTQIAAAALVRLARNNLKRDRLADAARSYARLEALGDVRVGEMPAALVAGLGRIAVFERERDHKHLTAEAESMSRALRSGRWPISYATYRYFDAEASRRIPSRAPEPAARLLLAEAVSSQWDTWTRGDLAPAGRVSLALTSGPATIVWRRTESRLVAFVSAPDYLADGWLRQLEPFVGAQHSRAVMTTPGGQPVVGSTTPADHPAVRLASSTLLPWTIQVVSTGDADPAQRERRTILLAGMGVLFGFILVGAWFIEHGIASEFALAELQSGFVSAVSHEFRTPLTTLCQLSELLVRDRVASDDDRRQYYLLLSRESQRLRRLVETLLNFGRLEAGRSQFRFEPLDVGPLLREAVEAFSTADQALGHVVELRIYAEPAIASVDREMLRAAFWNLLENAVKYSPGRSSVWADLTRANGHVSVAIRDEGVGLVDGEHERIFEKFVRGSAARASDIRGTGVGLALARQIVRAHGGDITVASQAGRGSTFTVVLPTLDNRRT